MSGGATHLQGAAKVSEQVSVMAAGCQQMHEEEHPGLQCSMQIVSCQGTSGCLASMTEEVKGSHDAPLRAAIV